MQHGGPREFICILCSTMQEQKKKAKQQALLAEFQQNQLKAKEAKKRQEEEEQRFMTMIKAAIFVFGVLVAMIAFWLAS